MPDNLSRNEYLLRTDQVRKRLRDFGLQPEQFVFKDLLRVPELPTVEQIAQRLSENGLLDSQAERAEEIATALLRTLNTPSPLLFYSNPTATHSQNESMKPTAKYDALISYRREEPDKQFARDLLHALEHNGFTVAIDERDFASNKPFLDEMERCIKESRFTITIITPRFFESGNTQMEARIRAVLDMSNRTYCLIPIILEKTELPTWIYQLSSIDYTDPKPLISPYSKLLQTLGKPGSTS